MGSKKLQLGGGVGGRSGERVYTAPNGVVVTSSAPTYSNSDYYYMEYLFNDTKVYNDFHSYWLTNSTGNQTLTFDFNSLDRESMKLNKVVVYPAIRDDAGSNYRILVSNDGASWEERVPWVTTEKRVLQRYEHNIELEERYVRFELTRDGSWGVGLNEIEFYYETGTHLRKHQEFNFGYTGNIQSFQVPFSGAYLLEVWGAQGGRGGGRGGYSRGEVHLNAGEFIYVVVGGQGQTVTTGSASGGYNGGAPIRASSRSSTQRGAGGGATHIAKRSGLLSSLNLYREDVLLVAGGGGGRGTSEHGGHGGGLNGIRGNGTIGTAYNGVYGGGGSQTEGGRYSPTGQTTAYGQNGSFGRGGQGAGGNNSYTPGGGGGGGWFGGGGGNSGSPASSGGGGGGSSYIGGVDEGLTIAGNQDSPAPFGGTQEGNAGHGFARITSLRTSLAYVEEFDAPLEVIRDDVEVTALINHDHGGEVSYRLLLNGEPISEWSEYTTAPVNVQDYVSNHLLKAEQRNWLEIEVRDEHEDVDWEGREVYKVNNLPTLEASIDRTTIKEENVVIAGKLTDRDDDRVRFRVMVNGSIASNWTAYQFPPYQFRATVHNSFFTQPTNILRVEYQDSEVEDIKAQQWTVTLYNNDPKIDTDKEEYNIHSENAVIFFKGIDQDGDKYRYKVFLDDVQVLPTHGWSPYLDSGTEVEVGFLNRDLEVGTYTLRIEIEDDYRMAGSASKEVTITKINHDPEVEDFDVRGNTLTARILDEDNDHVRFRLLLNDEQVFPTNSEYSSYRTVPVDIQYVMPMDKVNIGQPNKVTLEVEDTLGAKYVRTGTFIIDYAGILFHDESGNYYSSDIGEILRILHTGTVVAGNSSSIYRVFLKNTAGFKVGNIKLYPDHRDLGGEHAFVELSWTRDPFVPEEELTYGELEHGEAFPFFVRVNTTEEATDGGQFDIYAEADPIR